MRLNDNINATSRSNYGLMTSSQATEYGVRRKDLLE